MESESIINGDCWVAYFDVIGFRNLVSNHVCNSRQAFGEARLEEFVQDDYYEILNEAKKNVKQRRELLPNIHVAWFSDTFVFYMKAEDADYGPTESFVAIEGLAQFLLVGCIWNNFGLRGAISRDDFYADTRENVFVGPALIDAYDFTENQNWIGFVVAPKAEEMLSKAGLPLDKCPVAYRKYNIPVRLKYITDQGICVKPGSERLYAA